MSADFSSKKRLEMATANIERCRNYDPRPPEGRTENEETIVILGDEIDRLRADAERYRWLMTHPDECAGVIADAYSGWDTEKPWREAVESEIAHRGFVFETTLKQGPPEVCCCRWDHENGQRRTTDPHCTVHGVSRA